jgi:Tol biopolymer transport system component
MSLTPGSRLGPYEIIAAVGAGGMGEVFRARDTKLGREVAIKVLPAAFAQDHERVSRFKREAQILASLNHPNIAGIYGLEESPPGAGAESLVALVLEFVEGEDLAQRLRSAPIPMDEALGIAKQIAEALEEAHERGIVHRDLKPANVKVTPDGKVKVLDFGLAKAMEAEGGGASGSDLAHSPTMTRAATEAGIILGTAAYMSPEQARGKKIDKRSDIWSFGVVLYEMLTRRRLFTGETASDILAAVLTRDPDWATLPPETPPRVRELLRRCLERNPKQRLHDIADARLELEAPSISGSWSGALAAPAPAPPGRGRVFGLAGMAFAAVLVATVVWQGLREETPAPLSRLSIVAPPGGSLFPDPTGIAISPDGTMVAFVVGDATRSDSQVWVRSLDSMTARRLEGTEGGNLPFWSPDSRRIGFFTSSKLKVVAASGGRAEVLCDATNGRGASWGGSNVIVFAPNWSGPLMRVPGTGGTPAPVTTIDASRKQYGHRFPSFLPDGEHFLYAALPGRDGKFDVFVGSVSGGTPVEVGTMEGAPVYSPPGFLLHMKQGRLTAQPFDAAALKTTGESVLLDDEPASILDPAFSYTAGTSASVSRGGTLTYFTTPSTNTRAVWMDAMGRIGGPVDLPPGHYDTVTVSPDGSRAIFVRSNSPSESSLWMADLARGGSAPLSSTGRGRSDVPTWSPDGTRVAFTSDREGAQEVYVKNALDASPEVLLYRNGKPFKNTTSWSRDGKWLALTQLDPDSQQNVWLLPASGQGELVSLVHGPGRDNSSWFSPDGRWLSHTSDDTGRFEIYIQSIPGPGRRLQVSQGGGLWNWWTPDGRGMLFVDDKARSLWRVDLDLGPTPRVSVPRQVANLPPNVLWLDAVPGREKFVALIPEQAGPGSIAVVQNWQKALSTKP